MQTTRHDPSSWWYREERQIRAVGSLWISQAWQCILFVVVMGGITMNLSNDPCQIFGHSEPRDCHFVKSRRCFMRYSHTVEIVQE